MYCNKQSGELPRPMHWWKGIWEIWEATSLSRNMLSSCHTWLHVRSSIASNTLTSMAWENQLEWVLLTRHHYSFWSLLDAMYILCIALHCDVSSQTSLLHNQSYSLSSQSHSLSFQSHSLSSQSHSLSSQSYSLSFHSYSLSSQSYSLSFQSLLLSVQSHSFPQVPRRRLHSSHRRRRWSTFLTIFPFKSPTPFRFQTVRRSCPSDKEFSNLTMISALLFQAHSIFLLWLIARFSHLILPRH